MFKKIVIGEVLKPQGIRGEVKIKPLIDDVSDLKSVKKVFIGDTEYKIGDESNKRAISGFILDFS